MRKILASDYDGTFYLNNQNIIENIEKVKEFRTKGNVFVIATGNNYEKFIKTIKKYSIKYDYLILDDGAVILKNDGNIVYGSFIESYVVEEIYKKLKKQNYNVQLFDVWKKKKNYEENNITKISININDLNEAQKLTYELNKLYNNHIHAYTMIFDDTNIVEIVSSNIDKRKAIEEISNLEHIENANTYFVGDGYNDIEAIKYFKRILYV